MIVLIDGDQIAYSAAFACEQEFKWDEDTWSLTSSEAELSSVIEGYIDKAHRDTGADEYRVALSSPNNFRVSLYPAYKGNRKARKPLGLKFCRQYLLDNHDAKLEDGFEADDLLGIWASDDYNKVIWAADKDFLTIPCNLFRDNKLQRISLREADKYLMIQTLTGDTIDNYKGAKGYGEKTAKKWLDINGYSWEAVEAAFLKAGHTKNEFETNAKLARILRSYEDIDWRPIYD